MNLNEIRQRLQSLNKKTSKRRDLWRPQDKHTIRLLAYPHGDEPIIELGFHYEIGDTRSLLCPKHNSGSECAICEFAEKLRNWNDPDTGDEKPEAVRMADFEIFKKIQVKERWYVPMIERGHEEGGPKFWSFGKSIYEQLLKMCLDDEMNDEVTHEGGTLVLTDTACAYDITVDFYKPRNEDGKGNMKSWPFTEIKEKKRPSKLAETRAEIDKLLEAIPDFKEVYPAVSSEEVEKAFQQFINSGMSEAKVDDVGTEKYEANTAEAPVVGGQSIEDAFGDLTAE